MLDTLKELWKQPYWVIALIVGAVLLIFPCITYKAGEFTPHGPSSFWPFGIGMLLMLVSLVSFGFTLVSDRSRNANNISGGLDLTRVKEADGRLWTVVGGCEIRVVEGRIEKYVADGGVAIVLPCNEYFDDECAKDPKSALGAYVHEEFKGQVDAFISLMKREAKKSLGPGSQQQKTPQKFAESFGPGRCILISKPLGSRVPIALFSTTTQRANQGLSGRFRYLFDGMQELVSLLSNARLNEVVMPVLAAGYGKIDPALAFVALLIAVAETARYGDARLKRVTIIVFKPNADLLPEVDRVIVRRALALIGSRD